MRRGLPVALAALAAFPLLPADSAAAPLRLRLEPLHLAIERLDDTYTAVAGLQSRASARVALGAALDWGGCVQLACGVGRGSARTDFGLLDGPTARLERADTSVELRWRLPFEMRGWSMQAAVGGGRLQLRYRPERLTFAVGGAEFDVGLDPFGAWTRQLAAELLHDLPGSGQLVLRTAGRFYTLDVATPNGTQRRAVRDLQVGVAIRVAIF